MMRISNDAALIVLPKLCFTCCAVPVVLPLPAVSKTHSRCVLSQGCRTAVAGPLHARARRQLSHDELCGGTRHPGPQVSRSQPRHFR